MAAADAGAAADAAGFPPPPPPEEATEAAAAPPPPQDFGRVRALWRGVCDAYPAEQWPGEKEDAEKEGGEAPARAALRAVLTALSAVFGAAADNCPECDAGGGAVPEEFACVAAGSPHHAVLCGEGAGVAAPLLRLAGWATEGGTVRLQEPHSPQLLRAAKHFAEAKLGIGAVDPEQVTGVTTMGMMMGMGDFGDEEGEADEERLRPDPAVDLDIEALILQVRDERRLPTRQQMRELTLRARDLLLLEDNLIEVPVPATLVGDIHGQYWDLLFQILSKGGDPANTRYVFLGDFVDRGEHSLLCLALIVLYKIRNPSNITLLRGNHESRITNNMYGFHNECRQMYPGAVSNQTSLGCSPDNEIWVLFNKLFDAMPLAALVGGRVYCCHGGLSPQLMSLERLLTFDRVRDIIPPSPMADVTWSDPGTCTGWRLNARGSGYLFGEDVTKKFCEENRLSYVARAHQCVKEGFRWDHDRRLVTIFSAPNYCWQQNKGALLLLGEALEEQFVVYEEAERPPEGVAPPPETLPAYFDGAEGVDADDDDDEKEDGAGGAAGAAEGGGAAAAAEQPPPPVAS